LVRQLLIEGLVVSWAAAIISMPLADLMMQLISRANLPLFVSGRSLDLTPDWRIFAAVAGLSTLSGVLLGLVPAWRVRQYDLRSSMMGSARRTAFGTWDLRYMLAAAQVAICLVLAVGAGLLSKSAIGLLRTDLGFNPDRVTLFGLESYLAPSSDAERGFRLSQELLARVRQLPGVEAAALSHDVLPTPMRTMTDIVALEADDPVARSGVSVPYNVVTPGYFETVRMAIVAGRSFTERDSNTVAATVAIVNERLARRLWHEPARALGQRIRLRGETSDREIVGVARSAVYREIDETPLPYLFLPDDKTWAGAMTLHVRGPKDPTMLIGQIRGELHRLNPSLAFADIRTMNDHVASRMAGSSLAAYLSVGASAAGLALAAMGLDAVLAYLVSQRRRELAIRMSLGAGPTHIVRFITRVGLRIILIGVIGGLFASLATTKLIATQLRGVAAGDPTVYLAVVVLVVVIALGACLLPAWRAGRLEPWAILRR
ncbi:MAG: FtsX-like permease family protein, partial [Acidobacteriota bacterium]